MFSSRDPEHFERRVLLAVVGLSPQVLTETLYALAVQSSPAFIPTEVQVITTAEGAARIRLALLSEEPGWFARLVKDYRLPSIAFDEAHVHVIPGSNGVPIDDIRTVDQNGCAADFITERIRVLSRDEDTAIHVSVAGGRKTMGFYLGYALSLFGRPQDRLSHVLVSEPYESCWDFFYPTPYSKVVTTRDNKLIDTRDAHVTLAEIPFVTLRHGLPESLLAGQARFSDVVAAARTAIAPPELVIDLSARRIRAGGRTLSLPPAELALLTVFARGVLEGEPALSAPPKDVADPAWARRYLDALRTICGSARDLGATEHALRAGMDGQYFSSHLSKLRARLRRALGATATPYLVEDGGGRPRRFRLALQASQVTFAALMHDE